MKRIFIEVKKDPDLNIADYSYMRPKKHYFNWFGMDMISVLRRTIGGSAYIGTTIYGDIQLVIFGFDDELVRIVVDYKDMPHNFDQPSPALFGLE